MEREVKANEKRGGVGHILANVIGTVLCVVFIPIIICNAVLIIRSYREPEKLPMVFGYSPVIVMSGSMYPEFNTGDMILLQKVDPYTVKEGDVICFFEDGDKDSAVTHRVIEIHDQGGVPAFVTQGDANNTADQTAVTVDMVQGKYAGIYIAGLGRVAIFLQSTMGMVLCIVAPLLLIILWDVFRRMLSSRKEAGKAKAMEAELERLRAQISQQENGGADPPAL